MKNKSLIYLVILFQVLVLGGMFVKAFYPVMVGTAIKLKVLPIDPRDLFRGNYVNLGYDFSTIDLDFIKNDLDSITLSKISYGDELFVELALDSAKEFYQTIAVWKDKSKKTNPENILLHATPNQNSLDFFGNGAGRYRTINLTAGIESFFTNQQKALSLEEKMSPNWSFDPNREEYIVWSDVYVTDQGAVRMNNIDFREAVGNEKRRNNLTNLDLSEEECNKKTIASMYQSNFKEEIINSQISLIKLERNYEIDCYSNSYFGVIKIKSIDSDTLFMTGQLNYSYDLEFIEVKNNIFIFEKYDNYYTSTSMFYIIDLNKKKLYTTPFFDRVKTKEKYKISQNYDTIDFDTMPSDSVQSYELKDLHSITELPNFKNSQ